MSEEEEEEEEVDEGEEEGELVRRQDKQLDLYPDRWLGSELTTNLRIHYISAAAASKSSSCLVVIALLLFLSAGNNIFRCCWL